MKYNSVNRLSDFEFHDAWFSLDTFENNCLTVKALCLNIHKDAEQNPYETDMEIANALITFKGFKLQSYEPIRGWKQDENGNRYSDDPQIVLHGEEAYVCFLLQLKEGITVFDLGATDTSVHFIDAISKDPFFTVRFTFESVVIEWDDYKKEAWYTSKQ
ncbi:MAG: hypothetical protein II987_00100 [Clostridia bacterium]|nr:hypothetical protein [Clostridia bacterium]